MTIFADNLYAFRSYFIIVWYVKLFKKGMCAL